MMKTMLVLLLSAQSMCASAAFVKFAANEHAVASNLRVQSNASLMLTFKQGIFNNTVTNLMQNEVEMVLPYGIAKPPHVNKIAYILFAMMFGMCGCDRCFMGQVCFGCIKGLTGGGFIIWHLIDYFVALVSALTEAKDINMMGYHATFEEESVKGAFWIGVILLLLNAFQQINSLKNMNSQASTQNDQQAALLRAMNEMQAQQNAQNINNNVARQSLDIPKRHQSLAYIPTKLTKGLRKAGIVTETPTIPELIAAFDAMDTNGDGQLDHEEIMEGMKAMGASDEKVDKMIKAADKDGDGKISKNEFLLSYHMQGEK